MNTNNDAIVDGHTFRQMQDYQTALGVLMQHWDTWITEDEFIAMAGAGGRDSHTSSMATSSAFTRIRAHI
jgi:hypothetical protein